MNDKRADINVEAIAHLARLSLTDKERDELPEQLRAIIAFADKLSELDTENVPVTAHVVPIVNVLREDVPQNGVARDTLLANAPTKADGYVTVPRVVESEEA